MSRPGLAALLMVAAFPLVVSAQIVPRRPAPGQPPVTRRDTLTRRDSLNRRGLARDTTQKKDSALVNWTAADQTMQDLLNRRGYMVTRYEGDTVTFDAKRRAMRIVAGSKKQAAVQRGTQTVVTDTSIVYDETTKNATARGNIVLSDPSSGNADVHAIGTVTYNLAERSARITNPRFPIEMGETWYVTAHVGKMVAGAP